MDISNKAIILIEIVDDSIPSKMKKLNLNSNLSDIRKELNSINDIDRLLFAIKFSVNKFVEIDRENEEETEDEDEPPRQRRRSNSVRSSIDP